MSIVLILCMLWWHYVGDFLCQTAWMARNKHKGWKPLLAHTATYALSIATGLCIWYWLPWCQDLQSLSLAGLSCIALCAWISHWLIDFASSPIGKTAFDRMMMGDRIQRHARIFFWTWGLDQILHIGILLTACRLLS